MELSFHINLLERKSSGQPRFRTIQACPRDLPSVLRLDCSNPWGGSPHVRHETARVHHGAARRSGGQIATHAPSSLQNIRLSSDAANPLTAEAAMAAFAKFWRGES